MAIENFQCSMKLVHCLCLSRIFTNDRDSISFKIFAHDVSFTLEDFYIMCGLRITTHTVEKIINRESNILKRYFGKSKGVTLKDIRDFMTRNEIPKNVVNHSHVCESDDDAVKLMEILVVESILFGKKTESSVLEEYASIVEDDKVCAKYPWGNVTYEKLIYSPKHALDKQNKFRSTKYKVGGFPYPLCAWFYKRFPDIREKYIREDEYLDTPQRVTMEVQKHAGKERNTIVKEVFDKFKQDERSAIVDAIFVKVKEYFDEKFEQLFKIVDKSNGMDDGNFDLSNHRQYDRMNDCYEHLSDINVVDDASHKVADVNAIRGEAAFEGDQHIQEQVEEERSSIGRLNRDGNNEEQLSTENVGSKQGTDNQVVDTEEYVAHDASHKVTDDNATRKEAAVEGDEHVQQQVGEKDGNDEKLTTEKGADDQVVDTEKSCTELCFGKTIRKDYRYAKTLAICKELVGEDTQEISTTVEVETSCASIDTTQKLSNDVELNEDRVEKNLAENTPMLLDVGAQSNEAGTDDIDKGMEPGETTAEDKRQERLDAAQKEFGELMQLYQKGEIHLFTHVGSQTDIGISEGKGSGFVGMQTSYVSQHLDQISSDAS
ncbi:uncharacterized protein [Nicotiana sylvestris]|uniref:uncharacterized protein n=1 Tax=Nicotiana sylvestris TaxID=4096 RepID=UPI00388C4B16